MDSIPPISTEDEGKPVYDTDGTEVGIVTHVAGTEVAVDPDPDLTDTVAAKLGWTFMFDGGDDSYPISLTDIESVEDDRIVVGGSDP
jgi:hypothetical protein